jgi:predicted nucleotidyltransferase
MSVPITFTTIALMNRPRQLDLLASATKLLEGSPAVTHLLVRGSLAAGHADRSSDVDLVIGVRSDALQRFLISIDTLFRIELGSLFPGWRDSLAPDMGGVGFVYLVPFHDTLYELDVYVVPDNAVPAIARGNAQVIFAREKLAQPLMGPQKTDGGPSPGLASPDIAQELVVEIVVLLHMMTKRVNRRQTFIVHGLTYLITDAVRHLVKQCLVPQSRHWGWYYLDEELGADSRGVACLRELAALIAAPPIVDRAGIQKMFSGIGRVIACAAPHLWSRLEPEFEAYRHYSGLS